MKRVVKYGSWALCICAFSVQTGLIVWDYSQFSQLKQELQDQTERANMYMQERDGLQHLLAQMAPSKQAQPEPPKRTYFPLGTYGDKFQLPAGKIGPLTPVDPSLSLDPSHKRLETIDRILREKSQSIFARRTPIGQVDFEEAAEVAKWYESHTWMIQARFANHTFKKGSFEAVRGYDRMVSFVIIRDNKEEKRYANYSFKIDGGSLYPILYNFNKVSIQPLGKMKESPKVWAFKEDQKNTTLPHGKVDMDSVMELANGHIYYKTEEGSFEVEMTKEANGNWLYGTPKVSK